MATSNSREQHLSALLDKAVSALGKVTEQNQQLKEELRYTQDQRMFTEAQNSNLRAQVELFKAAQNVRQSGNDLNTKQSSNRFTLAGRNAVVNHQEGKANNSAIEKTTSESDVNSTPSV